MDKLTAKKRKNRATNTRGTRADKGVQDAPARSEPTNTRVYAIAARGIRTSKDFASLMSALITDLTSGAVSPGTGNAICNAGGKLLKIVEMEYRYGAIRGKERKPALTLSPGGGK